MLNIIYLSLAVIATAVTIYYAAFYEVSIPGSQYNLTYAGFAFVAALIFSSLWFAGIIHKEQPKSNVITDW